jgi:hypothetical protein
MLGRVFVRCDETERPAVPSGGSRGVTDQQLGRAVAVVDIAAPQLGLTPRRAQREIACSFSIRRARCSGFPFSALDAKRHSKVRPLPLERCRQ